MEPSCKYPPYIHTEMIGGLVLCVSSYKAYICRLCWSVLAPSLLLTESCGSSHKGFSTDFE